MEKAAELLSGAGSAAVFCSPALFKAARNLSLLIKVKVAAVPLEANARGVVSMGLVTEGKSYNDMISGGVDLLYAVGEVPVAKKPGAGFLVAQTSYMTDLAKEADIVLPAASPLESKGTIINYLGKAKDLSKTITPAGDAKQHKDIFIELSKVMGKPIKESAADMKKAFQVSSKPKFNAFEKTPGLDVNATELIEGVNRSVMNHSRLLWLKEAREAAV